MTLTEPQQRILERKFQRGSARSLAEAMKPCPVIALILEALGESATREELIDIARNVHYGLQFNGLTGAEDDNELGRIFRGVLTRYALSSVTDAELQDEANDLADMRNAA